MSACTYGPPRERSVTGQIVKLGDSYAALVLINHERLREPTGLSAFPDGGKARILEKRATIYHVDATPAKASRVAGFKATDDRWESFSVWVAGIDEDGTVHVRQNGCPRGQACGPDRIRSTYWRLHLDGRLEPIPELPPTARLPGVMLARRPGERNYVRFSTSGDTITARFDEGGSPEPVFSVAPDGSLHPIPGPER